MCLVILFGYIYSNNKLVYYTLEDRIRIRNRI